MKNIIHIHIFIAFLYLFSASVVQGQNWQWDGTGPGNAAAANMKGFYYDSVTNNTFMAGWFKYFDGIMVNGLCRYDGETVHPVGTGADNCGNIGCSSSGVGAIQRYNGKMYFGFVHNSFSGLEANGIVAWDGLSFSPLGEGLRNLNGDPWAGATEIAVFQGDLYASGPFELAGSDTTYNIARWDGEQWHKVGHPFYHPPLPPPGLWALKVFEGKLYVGGKFADTPGHYVNVARYDGETWETVGGGIKGAWGSIDFFEVYKGELYICGPFRETEGNAGNKIMKLVGDEWVDVGGSVPNPLYKVQHMTEFDDKLYAVGIFNEVGSDNLPANNIATWDGQQWCGLGSQFDNIVTRVGYWQDKLFIAGGFKTIDNDSINEFAEWKGGDFVDTCGMVFTSAGMEIKPEIQIKVYPNPVQERINIVFGDYFPKNASVSLYDTFGQIHMKQNLQTGWNILHLEGLQAGLYFYEIREGDVLLKSGKLVKVE